MIFNKQILSGAFLFTIATKLFAMDPITASLNQPFPNPVFTTGGVYSVVYTFTNALPLKLVKPLVILKSSNSPDEFTYVDQCTGQRLVPNASCTVGIYLKPLRSGDKRLQLAIAGYDNNVVYLKELLTTATGNTGVTITPAILTALPASMAVNTSAPYNFSFTNNGGTAANGVSVTANVLGFSTSCTPQLNPGASCEVSGTFMPTSTTPSSQTVTATLSFNEGTPVSISSTTTVTAAAGITGQLVQGLPAITTVNVAYPVIFSFTNNLSEQVIVDFENYSVTPVGAGTFVYTQNTCPSLEFFPAGATCTVQGNFTPTTTDIPITLTMEMVPIPPPPVSSAFVSTETVAALTNIGRIINFVNQCNFPVWFSLNGANRQVNQLDVPCVQDSDCPAGSRCNPGANGGSGLCFWANYGPIDNNFQLTANGGMNAVFIPTSTDPAIEWSGVISASTGCSGGSCLTANCQSNGGLTSCAPGVGFGQPATQAEITMEKLTVDTYDVEVINGFHIPIQMTPSGTGVVANNYTCGSPGSSTAAPNFGACNWNNARVPNQTFYWVGGGTGASCSAVMPCTVGGELCGLNIGINQVCGQFLGFWTANEACAINAANAAPFFNCNLYLNSPFPPNTYTLSDLYGCKTPDASEPLLNSCYKAGATTQCCGCANWQNLAIFPQIVLPPAPITENCVNSDPLWVSNVQNTLVWMKQACATAYTYPYDDKSSTFTCQDTNPVNSVDYTVTFCAGGFTGLPAGATEGRNG